MTGPDRALLYRTAAETGLRWSELRSLTRSSFDFAGDDATVTIAAAYAKNGKEDILPLRPELAADLKARMALFLPTAKAFPGMWAGKGAEMIRGDLEAAGIPLAAIQKLMRHSDPKLTAGIYTHVLVADKADESAKLPRIAAVAETSEESAARTGTDDALPPATAKSLSCRLTASYWTRGLK